MEINHKPKTDENLEVLDSDKKFDVIIKKYRKNIYNRIYKIIDNIEDANDLTTETFIKAFKNIDKYLPEYPFHIWLFTIADNSCIDFMRKKKILTTSIDKTNDNQTNNKINLQSDILSPEETIMQKEDNEIIRNIINSLSDRYRILIELRYFNDYSYQEIAEKLSIPIGTVKGQLSRAKESLLTKITKKNKE